eukprot:gene12432-15879_t
MSASAARARPPPPALLPDGAAILAAEEGGVSLYDMGGGEIICVRRRTGQHYAATCAAGTSASIDWVECEVCAGDLFGTERHARGEWTLRFPAPHDRAVATFWAQTRAAHAGAGFLVGDAAARWVRVPRPVSLTDADRLAMGEEACRAAALPFPDADDDAY